MQRVQTTDQENRLSAKAKLKGRIVEAFNSPASLAPEILLLPINWELLTDPELLFTLTNNAALKHSQESAVRTVNLLYGGEEVPAHVTFKEIDVLLRPLPDVAVEKPVQRKPMKPAPGFSRVSDSTPERIERENLKRQQIKMALSHKIHVALMPKPIPEPKKVLPLVQTYDLPPAERAELRSKPKPLPVRARDISGTSWNPDLPANYQDLSEKDLHYALTRDPQLQYTPEAASLVIDVLFGRREIPQPQAAPEPVVEAQAPPAALEDVLWLPKNYRDFSDVELHEILRTHPKLEHTDETASLTMQILRGWERPLKHVLKTTAFSVEKTVAPAKPVKRNVKKRVEATPPPGFVFQDTFDPAPAPAERPARTEPKVLLVPANYTEFNNDVALHEALLAIPELEHTEETALLAMQAYRGWVSPTEVTLLPTAVIATIPAPAPKVQIRNIKQRVEPEPPPGFVAETPEPKIVERKQIAEPKVLLLPANYADFKNDPALHAALLASPELGHTDETALLAMQAFRGWVGPLEVTLQTADLVAPLPVPEPKPLKRNVKAKREFLPPPGFVFTDTRPVVADRPERTEPKVLLFPANYAEFNNDAALHAALLTTPGLGHTEDTALLAMQTFRGWTSPLDAVLEPTEIVASLPVVEPKPIKRNIKEQREFTPPPWFVFNDTPPVEPTPRPERNTEPQVLLFPYNYTEFHTDTDLHAALLATAELGHTEESALLAMQAYRGWTNPVDVVLMPTEIIASVPEVQPRGRWVYVKEE